MAGLAIQLDGVEHSMMPPRIARPRRTAVRLFVVAFGLGAWMAFVLWPEPEGTLALPRAGEVASGYVDQHPVFIVHDANGAVRVLDATSPHDPFLKVLAWCQTSQMFEDLWHGSTFNNHGQWSGGPAPSGMAAYDVIERNPDSVVVGEKQPAPGRLPDDEQDPQGPQGPWCADRTSLSQPGHQADASVLDDLVLHDPAPGEVDPALWFPTAERILGQTDTRP